MINPDENTDTYLALLFLSMPANVALSVGATKLSRGDLAESVAARPRVIERVVFGQFILAMELVT